MYRSKFKCNKYIITKLTHEEVLRRYNQINSLTSIRKVHPSKLSNFRVVFLARAWHNSLEGWSSRANRGLDKSSNCRHGASVKASTNGITSAGLDAPAALRASKLRALLMVSPKQPASKPPRRHLDTFKDLNLQFGSLKHKTKCYRLVGLFRGKERELFFFIHNFTIYPKERRRSQNKIYWIGNIVLCKNELTINKVQQVLEI